ncbi:translocation and assembly module lipoprotein TamL [Tenacibaculum sp. C7A-26P2]|uniref:translocation and assembly module lipoprotein TamL n=1 Tax=Tenacibaculum sp. C7A-26P2 TaxID=3447504 RepID=UPI003F8459A6
MKKLSFYFLLFAILVGCNTVKHLKENELLLIKNTIYLDSVKTSKNELNELLIQRPNQKTFGLPLALNFYNLGNPEGPTSPSDWGKKYPKTYNFFKRFFSEKQSIAVAKSAIGLNNWFLKSGQKPIIIDDKKTNISLRNLKTYYQNHGYFKAKIQVKKDSISRKKGSLTYQIEKGQPLFLDTIFKTIKSPVLDSIYNLNKDYSFLKSNQKYDDANFVNETIRLTKLFRNNGLYHFDKNGSVNYWVEDTSAYKTNIELVLTDRLIESNGEYISKPYKVQRIKNINVFTDYTYNKKDNIINDTLSYEGINFYAFDKLKYNPKYLAQSLFIKPSAVYSDTLKNLTRTHLRGLKNFKSTSIRFKEINDHELEANIFLTPAEKYTLGIDSELSRSNVRNFDISGRFSLTNRNTFKGAEIFKISAHGAYFNSNNGPGWEVGGDISLEIPRFVAPFNLHKLVPKRMFPKTNFHGGISLQKNIGLDRQNLNIGIDYKWKFNATKTIQLEFLNTQYIRNLNTNNYFSIYQSEYSKLRDIYTTFSNGNVFFDNTFSNYEGIRNSLTEILNNSQFAITNPSERLTALNIRERLNIITSDFLIPEIAYSFTYNNQKNLKDQNFSFFKIRVANAGNILGLLSKAKNTNNQNTLFKIPIAQYFKTDVEYKKYWSLGENSVLAHRTSLGAIFTYNNSDIPFTKSYFAGGQNDIRGWRAYSLGPGTTPPGLEYNIGSLKFISSLEYRFGLIGSLNGALFIDSGNIWDITGSEFIDTNAKFDSFKSITDLAFSGGFGLRFDLKLLVLRLDHGFKIREPYKQKSDRWFSNFSFNISQVSFGINYPF